MNWRSRAGILAASVAALLCASIGAGSAQDAPVVPARFGSHPTYDRLVLDWPSNVGYRVDQQGSTATLVFDQAATLNEAQLRRDLGRVASAVTVAQSGSATTVTLQMMDGVRLRHFRSGAKVVLDFSHSDAPAAPTPPPTASAAATPSPAAAPTPAPAARTASSAPSSSAARPWELLPLPQTAAGPAAPANPAVQIPLPPAAGASADPASPPAAAPAQAAATTTAAPSPSRSPAASGTSAATPSTLPSDAEALEQLRSLSQQLATAPPVRLTPPSGGSSAAAPPPSGRAEPVPSATARRGAASSTPAKPGTGDDADTAAGGQTPAAPQRSQAFLDAQAKRTATRIAAAETKALGPPVPVVRSEGQGLRFKWPDPVTAAAFTRGPYVFLLFNKRAPLDLAAVRTPPPDDLVGDITQVPSEGTAVRLSPPPDTFFAVRAEDSDWVVEMTRRPRTPDAPAEVLTKNENDPAAARVQVALRGGETVVTLHDPEVGDDLKIVPTAVAGGGIEEDHVFPQFKILASAQGLVVKPEADGVIIRPLGRVTEIYSSGGTLLSSPDEAPADRTREADAGDTQPRLFNFSDWQRIDGRPYLTRLRELEQAVAAAQPAQRNPPRLALARFLFANGYAIEADGVLATMAREQPALANTRLYHALKGATSLIAGNLDEATTHLRHASLDREPEIAMWRVALEMAQGNPRAAIEQLSRGPDMSRRYPPPYANRLGLAISEALIDLGDIPAARDRLEAVFANDPAASEESQARYLRGRLAILEGKPDEARALWSALEGGNPSPARILATLSLVDMEMKENRLTPQQATARIEQLRYVWRGDDLEFAVLRKLGELALDSGDIRKGLRSLRDLIALKPDSREVTAVNRQMANALQRFFLQGGANQMTPVAAIGLFNEFRSLVPESQAGDAMLRNLADRLIKVDLLDQAADLLDYQIKNRLQGSAKAETGARLAFTRLLDSKPEGALTALTETDLPDIPVELARDRNRLAARALADLGRAPEALSRIADDPSADADTLRAEINWKIGDWAAAAKALARFMGEPPQGDAEVPDDQARAVVRYAAALALAGDQGALDSVRTKFGVAMAKGPYKDIFAVLASDRAGPMGDVRDIQARLATTAPFDSFLSAYRQRFGGTAG